MPVFQHYYTSFMDPATGEAGFRTMAESPGLDPETRGQLMRLIGYRIPSSFDDRDIGKHPIALRYAILSTGDRALMCSRSSGSDEQARPGNFFAHALIFRPEDVSGELAVDFWCDPLWQKSGSAAVHVLPVLGQVKAAAPFTLNRVWAFLDSEPGRRDWLSGLLDAVIRSTVDGRRIVILDTAEHVAAWVAAISHCLPSAARSSLTFSTYDHDPYRTPYLITGTTRDSSFQFNPLEFQQYFVLDVKGHQISENKPGPYSAFVAERFTPPQGAEELVQFFAFCDRRLGKAPAFDGRLDRLTTLFELLVRDDWSMISADELSALRLTLAELEQTDLWHAEDLSDLTLILGCLRAALVSSADRVLIHDLQVALELGRRHDPSFRFGLHSDLEVTASLFAQRGADGAAEMLSILAQAYGSDELSTAVTEPSYLSLLAENARDSARALADTWVTFGRYLQWPSQPNPLVDATLEVLEQGEGGTVTAADAAGLLNAIAATGDQSSREGMLAAAVAGRKDVSQERVLAELYWALVRDLPPDARSSLRSIAASGVQDLELFELQEELRSADPDTALAILRTWLRDREGRPDLQVAAVTQVVRSVLEQSKAVERKAVARRVLLDSNIAQLVDSNTEALLVATAFEQLAIRTPTTEERELYARYVDDPRILAETQGVMAASVALMNREFDASTIKFLNRRLPTLPAERYRVEAAELLKSSMAPGVKMETYANVMLACYVLSYERIFWDIHWERFQRVVAGEEGSGRRKLLSLGPSRRDKTQLEESGRWLVDILTFWFEGATERFRERPYLAQGFFLALPENLARLAISRGGRELVGWLEPQASTPPWYPIVARLLRPQRG